jgi:hypothetical protein
MCLEYGKVNAKKIFGDKKEITCWKVISRDNKRRRYRPPCQTLYYSLGKINISDRKCKKYNLEDDGCNSYKKGFHVFIKEKDAITWTLPGEYIIPVKCKKENYVAHNNEHVVFMAIEFPKRIKKEWKKNE